MVRASVNSGDPPQLRHPGHVSAVRGRCLCHESLQNFTGKKQISYFYLITEALTVKGT